MYRSTKTYRQAFSVAFRQFRANSHCQYLHGYAISVEFQWEATQLDARNWVIDFGGLKDLKAKLEERYDHKTLVAHDDPHFSWFVEGQRLGTLQMTIVYAAGCEALAEDIWGLADRWLRLNNHHKRVRVASVEVSEHDGNSAIYTPPE